MNTLQIKGLVTAGALLSLATAAAAQVRDRNDDFGHMWGGSYGMDHGFFGGFLMLAVWAALIALVVIAVRWSMQQGTGRRSSALDILQQRLAKGEIDPKEYDERKKALEA